MHCGILLCLRSSSSFSRFHNSAMDEMTRNQIWNLKIKLLGCRQTVIAGLWLCVCCERDRFAPINASLFPLHYKLICFGFFFKCGCEPRKSHHNRYFSEQQSRSFCYQSRSRRVASLGFNENQNQTLMTWKQKSQSSDRDSSFCLCHAVKGGTWPSSEEETSFWIQDNVRVINTAFKISTKKKTSPSSEACFDKLSSCHSDQTLWSLTSGKEREREKNTACKMFKNKHFHPRFQTLNWSWLAGSRWGSCLQAQNFLGPSRCSCGILSVCFFFFFLQRTHNAEKCEIWRGLACLGCLLKAAPHWLHLFQGKNQPDLYSRYGSTRTSSACFVCLPHPKELRLYIKFTLIDLTISKALWVPLFCPTLNI